MQVALLVGKIIEFALLPCMGGTGWCGVTAEVVVVVVATVGVVSSARTGGKPFKMRTLPKPKCQKNVVFKIDA